MMTELALGGEAREVALAEAQAVRTHAHDKSMRERLTNLIASVDEGQVGGDAAELLESVLELGLQTGRIRAYYGPGGEQAAVATLRKLPRAKGRAESARDVTEALHTLAGAQLDKVGIGVHSPGVFTLTIEAGGVEAHVRLDGNGARLVSLGT